MIINGMPRYLPYLVYEDMGLQIKNIYFSVLLTSARTPYILREIDSTINEE